jgi:hypothetical protein
LARTLEKPLIGKLNLAMNSFRNLIVGCLTAFTLSSLMGCAWQFQRRSSAEALPSLSAIPLALEAVKWPAADSIQIDEAPKRNGTPVDLVDEQLVRPLLLEQCESLAADNSRIAIQLQTEKRILQSQLPCGSPIFCLLDLQTQHERNVAAGKALLAHYQLAEVYLQNSVVLDSQSELDTAAKRLEKVKEQIAIGDQDRELERQRMKAVQHQSDLRYGQAMLSEQLELMLNLQSEPSQPLWTLLDHEHLIDSVDDPNSKLEAAIALALANRSDLAALEYVLNCATCNTDLLELVKRSASGVHPLAGLSTKPPFRVWLFRKHWQELWDRADMNQRREQFAQIVVDKKTAIRLEVTEAWHSLEKSRTQTAIDHQLMSSLLASKAMFAKAADMQDGENQAAAQERELELTSQLFQVESDLIKHAISAKSDQIRLKQALGLLGQ